MTVITAVQKGDEIAIACDTQSTSGGLKYTADYLVNHHKLLTHGDSIFGLSGSVAVQQVFEDLLLKTEPVSLTSRNDIFRWLLSHQAKLKDEYYVKTNVGTDQEQVVEASWVFGLVANPHGIFGISRYRSVLQYSRFWAIGSGGTYALGAMEILYGQDLSASEIAEAGALAATKFNTGCAPPVRVEIIRKQTASSGGKAKRKTTPKTPSKAPSRTTSKTSSKATSKAPSKATSKTASKTTSKTTTSKTTPKTTSKTSAKTRKTTSKTSKTTSKATTTRKKKT